MGRRWKLNYTEGACFLVTLEGGGFARGVVARHNRRGVVFGYFFGPPLTSVEEATTDDLRPERAVLRGMFGDLFILQGKWPILEQVKNWVPKEWPMPPLVRVDDAARRATLSYYDDRTFRGLREEEVPLSAVKLYPYDSTMGAGAAELCVARLLSHFQEPPELGVTTTAQILAGSPILVVTHDAEEGGWQFLGGKATDPSDRRTVPLQEIEKMDPGIIELSDLPLGWMAIRTTVGANWVRWAMKKA